MMLLRRPRDEDLRALIAANQNQDYSYGPTGITRGAAPKGFVKDHNRIQLGSGQACFERASAALRAWTMFDLGWIRAFPNDTPIEVGAMVAVVSHQLALWTVNLSRILYLVKSDAAVERFGFAYGTLPCHVERGEERFTLEWHLSDDSVWYDILAYSRPRHPLVWLGYPYARACQKRFARDSKAAMQRAGSPRAETRS